MVYKFKSEDYYELIDELSEKYGSFYGKLKSFKIDENGESELYAYGMRIVIPALGISIREGDEELIGDGYESYDTFIIYAEDEKDPVKYVESYCNTSLSMIVVSTGTSKGMSKGEIREIECFMDENEFDWDEY